MNLAEIKRKKIQAISIVLAFLNLIYISKISGYQGVTYLMVCMEIYGVFAVVINGGLSDVLGRLIRIRNAKGQYRSSENIKRYTFMLQLISGSLGMVILFFSGKTLVAFMGDMKYCRFIILLFAPLVLLRSLSCLLSGLVKGQGTELPESIAVVLRQILIFVVSMIFCKMLGEYGEKVSHLLRQENFKSMYIDVGVMIALLLSEVFVTVFLFLIHKAVGRYNQKETKEGFRSAESVMDCIRLVLGNRLPMMLILLLLLLTFPVCFKVYINNAAETENAVIHYGMFSAEYLSVIGILLCVLNIPMFTMVGKLRQTIKKNENRYMNFVFQSGVHFLIIITVYWVVFLAVMSEHIGIVICKEAGAILEKMYTAGSGLILTVTLSLYFGRVLLLKGKRVWLIISVMVYDVVQILFIILMNKRFTDDYMLLVYSLTLGFAVLCVMLGILCYVCMRQSIDWLQCIVIPVAVGSISGLLSMLIAKLISPHMGSLVTIIVCGVITFALYWTGLLLTRNIRDQELEVLPYAKLLEGAGQLLRVF